jgi:5'-nucleotidase
VIKTLYVDMDNVLVDFPSGIARLSEQERITFEGHLDEVPGIFSKMDPLEGAISSFDKLSKRFDTYILSTAPWENPSAWTDKLLWVKKHLGQAAHKRLILSHHKNLCAGDYLIDDRLKNGVEKFAGEHIHFGTERFPDWNAVCKYLLT